MHHSPARRRLAIAMRAAVITAFAVALSPPSGQRDVRLGRRGAGHRMDQQRPIDRGLAPLRSDGDLAAIAGIRASRMASAN